jgi:hypothetical protein
VAKLTVKAGSTSRLEHVFILDSTSATGAGKTALTNASVTAFYFRPGDTTTTGRSITLAAGTLGTWSSGGFIQVNATDMPGLYEIGIPNAIFAAGVNHAVVMIKGTGIAPVLLEYELVAYDPLDTVRLGLTALPNAVAGAVGGLPTGDASGRVTVADKTGYSLATAPLDATQTAAAVWNALLATYTTTNSFGARVVRTLSSSTTNEVTIGASNHIAANVHAMQNNTITAAAIATGAVDADALATDAVNEIADGLLNRSLATAGAAGNITITSIVSSVFQAANTLVLNDQVIFIGTAPVSFTLGAIYFVTSASLSSTTFTLASTLGGVAVSTSSTGAFTARKLQDRTVLSAFQYLRNKVAISGSTMTVSAEDDTTTAWTAALTTSPGVDPVTTLDPA